MPLYEYLCESCGRTTEILQRLDEPPLAVCPHCGGPMRKLLSAPAFQFKGSGWYVTDYARRSAGGGEKAKTGASDSAASRQSSSSAEKSADAGSGARSESPAKDASKSDPGPSKPST